MKQSRWNLLILVLCLLMCSFAFAGLRIKNFREIFASYESITGISSKDADIQEIYRLNKDRLPRQGLVQEFGSPVVLAMTELSGAFCTKSVTKEKGQSYGERILFPYIDFERGPIQFTDYQIGVVSNHLSQSFWNRDVMPQEKAVMIQLMKDLAGQKLSSKEETLKMARVLCTSYASSLAFLVK